MQSRGPSGTSGSDGNDPHEKENYEEYQKRINKRGEYRGLALIVLAHAQSLMPIYIYVMQPVPYTCIHF